MLVTPRWRMVTATTISARRVKGRHGGSDVSEPGTKSRRHVVGMHKE